MLLAVQLDRSISRALQDYVNLRMVTVIMNLGVLADVGQMHSTRKFFPIRKGSPGCSARASHGRQLGQIDDFRLGRCSLNHHTVAIKLGWPMGGSVGRALTQSRVALGRRLSPLGEGGFELPKR